MAILSYIFYIGVIHLIFRFIWSLFFNLLVSLNGKPIGLTPQRILSAIFIYLQVSLIASLSLDNIFNDIDVTLLMIFGGFVNFILLFSRFNKRKQNMNFVINGKNMIPDTSKKRDSVEYTLVIFGALYFFVPFYLQEILQYPFLDWLMSIIKDTYQAPIIGWIFKLIGAVYLVIILSRSVNFIFSSILPNKKQNLDQDNEPDSDSHFDDYEEVE
jgi:hypothetical protein